MIGQIKGNCKVSIPLTGAESCAKQEGKVAALIVTGLYAYYPVEESEFIAGLEGNVVSVGSDKIYPIKNIVGMSISGGDINAPELGTYGGPAPTNLNAKNVAYQINGGDCLYKELAKLNKRKMRLFRVDDEGYVYGTIVKKNEQYYFAGFECTLYAMRTPTDGSSAYNLSLYAYYTPNNEDEEKNMSAINVGLVNIPDGLIGITLKKGKTAGTASVITGCGGEDITSEYGSKWETSMFVNEAGANPETVTFDENTGLLTIAPTAAYRVVGSATLGIDGLEGLNEFVDLK